MKIYTKTGDKGKTSLLSGRRVDKFHERIEAYGTIDELNSFVGLLRSCTLAVDLKDILINIQDKLLRIGSLLAMDEQPVDFKLPGVKPADYDLLEKSMDEMEATIPPISNFLLPGGNQIVAYCHIARTICRRAERQVVKLNENEPVDETLIIYLNRLSDYFFVLSRKLSHDTNAEEIIWKPED